jgi:hypothetical protein
MKPVQKIFLGLLLIASTTSCFDNSDKFVEDKSFYDLPVYGKLIEKLATDHFIMMGIKSVPNGEVCYYKFDGFTRPKQEIEQVLALVDSSILEAKTWMEDIKAKKENGNNATYAKISCVTKIFEDRKNEYLKRLGITPEVPAQLAQK